jgi:hypothetical protein
MRKQVEKSQDLNSNMSEYKVYSFNCFFYVAFTGLTEHLPDDIQQIIENTGLKLEKKVLSTNAHFKPLKFKWPLTIRE